MSDRKKDKPAPNIDLAVDFDNKWAIYRGRKIFLRNRPTYLKLLNLLSEAYPDPVPTNTLIANIWSGNRSVGENNVYNTRKRLSETLKPFGLAIIMEPNGQGSRLVELGLPTAATSHREVGEGSSGRAILSGIGGLSDAGGYLQSSHVPLLLAHGALAEGSQWSDFISSAAMPSSDALKFADYHGGGDRRVIGEVIELFRHRYLESHLPLAALGWKPEEVLLLETGSLNASAIEKDTRVQEAFEASESTRIAQGKGTALEEPNGEKFAISDTSTPFHDLSTLKLSFKQTDYFSVLRARPAVAAHPAVRLEYGSLAPSENRIPGAAAIAFAALFSDGQILTIFRDKNSFPWPQTWSFSGEEQFTPIDFAWDAPERMKYAMLRTAQEELFPLARIYDKNQLLNAMQNVQQFITSMRVWSVFLEEPTTTFCIFCVFILGCTADQYRAAIQEMIRRGLGEMSNEGKYYAVPLSATPGLLQGLTLEATQIFGTKRRLVNPEKLHPMSRYRLLRLLDALHRASNTLIS